MTIEKCIRNGYEFQCDFKRPFVRFLGGGSERTALPPVADPIPTPEDIETQALAKGQAERGKIRARKGRVGTILTEATLGTTTPTKSPILGTVGGI